MDKMSVSQAREEFSEVINQVNYSGQRVIIHRRGKPLVAVISVSDLEFLELIEDTLDIEAAKKSLIDAKKKGTVSWAALKKELKL